MDILDLHSTMWWKVDKGLIEKKKLHYTGFTILCSSRACESSIISSNCIKEKDVFSGFASVDGNFQAISEISIRGIQRQPESFVRFLQKFRDQFRPRFYQS